MNLCEFPMTVLYGDAGDGYLNGLVQICTLFAPNSSLRFSTLTPLASCSYGTCISTTNVPGSGEPRICVNFP